MSFPKYPSYKSSGVPWLGEIPVHWEVMQSRRMFAVRSEPAREGDRQLTASQKHGVIFQSDFVEMEGRRVVEVIKGVESLLHVEPNDFIISMRSFQGGIEWCRLKGSTSFHYVMLAPVKGVHPPYFAHLFKSAPYIQALRSTTDLIRDGQELRYSHFVQIDLPVVPLREQATIATFLHGETAKIDALVTISSMSAFRLPRDGCANGWRSP
jgi:type I restriction enzyme S subunit